MTTTPSRMGLPLITVLLVTGPLALAETGTTETEQRLDTVEVAGLRPLAAEDLTASLTRLDAADLAVRNAPYLADQLRGVPGLAVSRSGAAGGLTQLRIRGAEANHTLVLLDGIEVSDPTTGETDLGLFASLPLAAVEVVRGEQSVLYGSDAIGGVVNLRPAATPGLAGRIEGGSRGTFAGDLGLGVAGEQAEGSLSLFGTTTDGVDTSGRDGEADGSQALGGLASGAIDLSGGPGNWRLSGLVRYASSAVDTDPDLDFDGRLDNADRTTESEQATFGAALTGAGLGLDHQFRASFNTLTRENFADGSASDRSEGDRTKLAYSPAYTATLTGGEITLAGLLDFEREDYARIGEASPFGDPNQSRSFDTLGLAGEVRGEFGPLRLNASVRADDNDGAFDDATTWRAGAAYTVLPGGRVRASLGTGVKNPTFTELFGFFPGSFTGNPDLSPERSTSWEIGWDHEAGPVTYTLTWFEAALEDEIVTVFNPDFTASPANLAGESERRGLEAALRWTLSEAVSLSGSLAPIMSENDSGEDEIRVPEWTASLALDWTAPRREGLRAGLAVDYVGEQDDFDFGSFPARRVTLDAYWLVSATAEYPVTDRVSLTLRGDNLLDETVTDVFGFSGPGAGAYLGIRLR